MNTHLNPQGLCVSMWKNIPFWIITIYQLIETGKCNSFPLYIFCDDNANKFNCYVVTFSLPQARLITSLFNILSQCHSEQTTVIWFSWEITNSLLLYLGTKSVLVNLNVSTYQCHDIMIQQKYAIIKVLKCKKSRLVIFSAC